jgi:hypothetical protein
MEEVKKQGRGGRREGAGRKRKSGQVETHHVSLRCSKDVWEILIRQPSKTQYIEAAIREKFRRERYW